ncbi:MAG: dna damage response rtt109 protein [Lasallia pustulata]|uniref:histone acetyltransferase n=2 Tax=Lasallia pustulata TaxID=136370 RepID=A0A5M8PWI9_9LECA|nr:MAG: dna damage response rtt109 protein [Lasallia pustulata]
MTTSAHSQFTVKLADELHKSTQYRIHHLSTPPTRCPAIFFAPPGEKPERTYCESHFLSVSISLNSRTLQVFAIEVLIYTTEYLTTLFVSKADSTGYLHLIERPKRAPSPLKTISSVFLAHLVESRTRPGVKFVVSLFARAQDQYLFPGSIENDGKHVLDDRGLVKWWCRVLDPILRRYPAEKNSSVDVMKPGEDIGKQLRSKGYLIVPGCDAHETRSFLPASEKYESGGEGRWQPKDPLPLIRSPVLPPRCLIPHFPDDPKARFLDELEDELPENGARNGGSPSSKGATGRWRSVRTLEQFWEMMTFRQECSAGRLVGFIWGVFTPTELLGKSTQATVSEQQPTLPTPIQSQARDVILAAPESRLMSSQPNPSPLSPLPSSSAQPAQSRSTSSLAPKPRTKPMKKRKLTGPIPHRQPRIKGSVKSTAISKPERTKYYLWPSASRGEVVLAEKDYKRVNDLLLRLDYADKETALKSTERWIDEVAVAAGQKSWGMTVEGAKESSIADDAEEANPTSLDMTLIKKKKRVSAEGDVQEAAYQSLDPAAAPKMMDTGLVRKKPKLVPAPSEPSASSVENGINVLGAGLVRKKVKA